MSKPFSGFTIAMDCDIKQMNAKLREVKSQIISITSEVAAFKKSLKNDWNVDTFNSAMAAAKDAVAVTEEQVTELKKVLSELEASGATDAADKIELLKAKLVLAETAASKAKKSLTEIAGSEFKSSLKKADAELDLTKRKLDALSTGLNIKWNKSTFVRAQETAREAVEQTNKKVEVLQKELERLDADSTTDKTSLEYKELCTKLDETKVKAQQTEQEIGRINQIKLDRVTGILDKLGSNLLKSGAVMTAGITMPLAYVGKQALDTASQLNEVQNVVDQSFKEGAGAIDNWSKKLLDTHGLSELTAKKTSGMYKSMANGAKIADEAGSEMSKTITELTADFASFYDVSLEMANTALSSIFTGETESLKKYGIVMTEVNLEQFAMSQGLDTNLRDMEAAEKTTLRYNFILDQLKDVTGDYSRTSGEMANQTRTAGERFKTLSIELAQELLPIANDILKWANEQMKAFSGMSQAQKQTTILIIGLAAALGPAVTLFGGLAKGISLGKKAMAGFKTANDAATISQAALNAVMSANPFVLVAIALAAVVTATVSVISSITEATQKQKELDEAFQNSINSYNDYSKSVDENSAKSVAEIELADKLIERYGVLNGKVNKSTAEKEVLKSTVSELSALLGIEISLIDAEAIKFDKTALSLGNLTQARRNEIEQIAIRNKAIKAQESMLDLQEQKSAAQENLNNANKTKKNESDKTLFFNTSIYERLKAEDAVKKAQELMDKITKQEQNYQVQLDAYANFTPKDTGTPKSSALQATTKPAGTDKMANAEKDKRAEAEKQKLNYEMDLGIHTEQVYFEKLKAIRSSYYGDMKKDVESMTEEEYELNRDIYNQEKSLLGNRTSGVKTASTEQTKAVKEMYENQKKLAKNAYDQNKKLLKTAYDDEKKQINEHNAEQKKLLDKRYKDEVAAIEAAYKAKEEAINAQIKAIDKEIEARRRLKDEEEQKSQIDAVKAQLAFGKLDDFSRLELEAELKRLEQEQADYKWELEQESRKEALQTELENEKELADSRKEAAQELFEKSKEALQSQYDLSLEKLEETYSLNIENLETAYQMQTSQLESMFANSSTQMAKISGDFVNTITQGCAKAASALSGIMEQINASTRQASRASGGTVNYNNTNTQKTANINVSRGYTDAQVKRMADRILYE